MALLNPSFEDAGALPGEAAAWTLTAVTSLEVLAGFGASPEQAWEDFERWVGLAPDLGNVLTARGFLDFSVNGYEAFSQGWGVGAFLLELPPAQVVPAPLGPSEVESCESGWSNVPFARDWSDVTATMGVFDGEPREDFEDAWRSNEAFAWSWTVLASAAASFDGGNAESFGGTWTVMSTL